MNKAFQIAIILTIPADRKDLWEVFVFKSTQNFGDAPEQVAYWNQDDDFFGDGDEDEDDEDDEG